jgi:pyruvate dehydrogenase E2 component (dihydrolipoyllysine-residue acetyltransferase)
MAEVFVMPKLGLTMEEGSLNGWHVRLGDRIDVGDRICEVETDKLSVDVESPFAGILLRYVEPGASVPVGAPIAVIGAADEDAQQVRLFGDASAGPEAPEPPAPVPASAGAVESPRRAGRPASPLARKLAGELGVQLAAVRGTGPGGRITRADIERASSASGSAGDVPTAAPAAATPPPAAMPRAVIPPEAPIEVAQPTRKRRAIAASMMLSAAIPQFSLQREIDVVALEALLLRRRGWFAATQRPTVADAVGVAVARALAGRPAFLTSWSDDGLLRHPDVHLGVAVALTDGLVVPVITNADSRSLPEFAEIRRDLQQRAAKGALRAAETCGAVFTLSNLGPLGVDRFIALVNPPESGILALGRIRDDQARRILTLTLSVDHRVVDGADGARLLADVAAWLETGTAESMFEEA